MVSVGRLGAGEFIGLDGRFSRSFFDETLYGFFALLDGNNFLFQIVKQKSKTEFFEGVKGKSIKKEGNYWLFEGINSDKKTVQIKAKLIIGTDGTNGISSKQLAHFEMDKNHHCAAVRAYVKGIEGMENETNEFFLIKKYNPGYFWIFPLEMINPPFSMMVNCSSANAPFKGKSVMGSNWVNGPTNIGLLILIHFKFVQME